MDRLEAIYYSAQIPRNTAILTFLGLVFERLHLPGVYLPSGGYSPQELEREIHRLSELTPMTDEIRTLIGFLEFTKHVETLSDFLVLENKATSTFGNSQGVTMDVVGELYQAIHGPNKSGWTPMFYQGSHKNIPGSDEFIGYPGDYVYQVGALLNSSETGIPLVNDLPGLPVLGNQRTVPKNDATGLSTILAMQSLALGCPKIPVLHPKDLAEFRAENKAQLAIFRRSMLRYSAEFNKTIDSTNLKDFAKSTEFFVRTEIVPALEEISSVLNRPKKTFGRRALESVRLLPSLAAGAFTMEPSTLIAKFFATFAEEFISDLHGEGSKKDALKRSGLYYLATIKSIEHTD